MHDENADFCCVNRSNFNLRPLEVQQDVSGNKVYHYFFLLTFILRNRLVTLKKMGESIKVNEY